jgi:hypothetical protein
MFVTINGMTIDEAQHTHTHKHTHTHTHTHTVRRSGKSSKRTVCCKCSSRKLRLKPTACEEEDTCVSYEEEDT